MPSHAFLHPRNLRREVFVSTASVMMRKQVQRRSVTWPKSSTGIHPIFSMRQAWVTRSSPIFPSYWSHSWTTPILPSNMAGPTPTIMIDMGSEEACEGKRVNGWGEQA